MKKLLFLSLLSLSLSASSLGDKVSDSKDIEKDIKDKSEKINRAIADIVVMSTYSLFLKDKIVFYSQKQKELVSLMKD